MPAFPEGPEGPDSPLMPIGPCNYISLQSWAKLLGNFDTYRQPHRSLVSLVALFTLQRRFETDLELDI